jgi:tripeptidyl-peptidase-1
MYYEGSFTTAGGTSASAPIFSSVINRINEERIAIGKGPVGFINPTLYAHPEVLNDVYSGSNLGCVDGGFAAVDGWVSAMHACSLFLLTMPYESLTPVTNYCLRTL